jgi:hypothetical protein
MGIKDPQIRRSLIERALEYVKLGKKTGNIDKNSKTMVNPTQTTSSSSSSNTPEHPSAPPLDTIIARFEHECVVCMVEEVNK